MIMKLMKPNMILWMIHYSFIPLAIIITISSLGITVAGNPIPYTTMGDTFYSNIIYIFLLNIPLDAIVLYVSLRQIYLKKIHLDRNEQLNASTYFTKDNLLRKFLLPLYFIVLTGSIIDSLLADEVYDLGFYFFTGLFIISLSVFMIFLIFIDKKITYALRVSFNFLLLNFFGWIILENYLSEVKSNYDSSVSNDYIFYPILFLNVIMIVIFVRYYHSYVHSVRKQIIKGYLIPFHSIFLSLVIVAYLTSLTYVGLMVYGNETYGYETTTPTIGAVCEVDDNGDFIIRILKVDPGGYPDNLWYMSYYLVDRNRTIVHDIKGNVIDIHDLNFTHTNVNLSYKDADDDRRLSEGDFFMIKSVENGGVANTDHAFLLRHDLTGDRMNGWGTNLTA